MCGIVGYIGEKKATPILLNGLESLEYRGYDSAGVAVLDNGKITIIKDKGRVKHLQSLVANIPLKGTSGIAHTRWATHGKPCKENSHPHMDNYNEFAVVHNGIIENYNELREFLKNYGYNFISETDTEVIPNLIHFYFSKENNLLKAVQSTCKKLKGSYAIEVLSQKDPDKIIVVRKDSPLVIGKGESEHYIASDIPAILAYTKNIYLLDDEEYAVIMKNEIHFYDKNLVNHKKEVTKIDWDTNAAQKDGYADYMLKEIHEQPIAIRETIGHNFNVNEKCDLENFLFTKKELADINHIYIIACGTAMHAGLVGKNILEALCRIPVTVDIASEFRYRNPIITNKTLCIYISQSGETADTIAALKLAKLHGAKTIAATNVIGSSITREADYSLYTHAGPEIAVASTKAYTSQIVLLCKLAIYFAEQLNSCSDKILKEIKTELLNLPSKVETILSHTEKIQEFAKIIYTEKDIFYLGRGNDYYVALEGSLKLKEISYIHSEAYAAGELKHGTIALIEKGISVIGIITDPCLLEKSISNLQEVITRGAKTLVITNQSLNNANLDFIINIPDTDPLLSPILSVVPLQLLSYYTSKNKGLDVDKPRNLAKSVTVE